MIDLDERNDLKRPSPGDVAERFVILKYCIVYALSAPPRAMVAQWMRLWSQNEQSKFIANAASKREEFWVSLRALGLWEKLSPAELDLAKGTVLTMTEGQQFEATWRMEAALVLLWAIKAIDALPPFDTQASRDLLKHFPNMSLGEFIRGAALRSTSEIDVMRDIAELWHWRSRTRELEQDGQFVAPIDAAERLPSFHDVIRYTATKAHSQGRLNCIADGDFAVRGKPYRSMTTEKWNIVRSITLERHFALNWLCGYAPGNRWDDTPTDT